MPNIGERIKNLRKNAGLTQEELARKCGYKSLTTINKIELGINSVPLSVVEKIAEVFNVSPSYIMGWDSLTDPALLQFDNIRPIAKKRIPMLGEIACGTPRYASEDRESYVEAGTDINADFCLTARGDSMIGARIYSGDIVFCRSQNTVNNGEIAVVIINDEATLKRVYFYPESQKLVLQAENPAFEPLVYVGEELNEIRIMGKAIAFQSDVK